MPKPSGFAALASSSAAGGFSGGGFAAAAEVGTGFGAVAATSAAVPGFSFAAAKSNASPPSTAPGGTNQQFSFVKKVYVADATEDNAEPVVKSVFGPPDGAKDAAIGGAPSEASLPPVHDAKTGEEDEHAVFSAQSTLFEFDASKTWRERGRGEMRVNVSKLGGGPARLVMRSKGNLRLLMNASLWPDMVVTKMDDGKVGEQKNVDDAPVVEMVRQDVTKGRGGEYLFMGLMLAPLVVFNFHTRRRRRLPVSTPQ